MCLNLCFCLRASVFPFNGRCPFSDQCQPSPGFPDHSPGFPDPSPGSPRYLSPHHSSSPFMSSVCPEEGKHRMKLRESMYLWKKETTRLHFSSKLNFPLMDLRKGWRDGSAGKQGRGPWRQTSSQPAGDTGAHRFRREAHPPHSLPGDASTPSPSPMLLWPHSGPRTARCCPPPTCGDAIPSWQGPGCSGHHH